MSSLTQPRTILIGILALLCTWGAPAHAGRHGLPTTVDQLLDLDAGPFAIAHRGFGDNLGDDPSRPIENTVPAVRKGFRAGVSVVEVDVQLTKDGEVVAFHDDFLADGTCLNRLTLAALQARMPFVPALQAVLNQARQFNQSSGHLRGLLIVELKPAAPLCDPGDTQEHAIVSSVARIVRRMAMTEQVMLASLSPSLLFLAAEEAPEIARVLTVSGLQFLTAAEIQAVLRLPVTPIDKALGLGLQWAEVGDVYRLPGYRSVAELLTTAALARVRAVEADLFFLATAGAPFVDALHAFGLKAFGFTATNAAEWFFLASLGVDGIYTDDVPFGVAHEASIP